MTQDEVIAMAREAGMALAIDDSRYGYMERFAALVAAAEREAIAAHYAAHPYVEFFGRELADEIRARLTP